MVKRCRLGVLGQMRQLSNHSMEGTRSGIISINGCIEEVLSRRLQFVGSAQSVEKTLGGAKIGNYNSVSNLAAQGRGEYDILPAETEIPAPAITTIFRFERNASVSFWSFWLSALWSDSSVLS